MTNIFKSLFGKSDAQGDEQSRDHKDPVCGMRVKSDSITAEYQGKSYYFCSEQCKAQFLAKPTNFVD